MNQQKFTKGLLMPVVVTVLLTGLFLWLLINFNLHNKKVTDDLKQGKAVVLSPSCDSVALAEIIYNNGYAETVGDAQCIAGVLVDRQRQGYRLSSLFALQKRALGQVPASLLTDTTGGLHSRWQMSCKLLGQDISAFEYKKDTAHWGNGKIVVSVKREDSLSPKKMIPCQDVPVRLVLHYRDSLNQAAFKVLGVLSTDSMGRVLFEGLDTEASYSVLPVKTGFEYGASKGTRGGRWKLDKKGEMHFVFEEIEHRIPLFDNYTLKQIKNDRLIMVRSPKEFRLQMVKWFVFVMLGWWALCLYLLVKKREIDGALIASCMFLTVLSVLMMFSMQDPLNDEMNGPMMGKGVLIGLVTCALLQHVDFVRFYQNNYKVGFDIPMWMAGKLLPKRIRDGLPKGFGWVVLALLLTAMLWTPMGQAVGGMKVNINLFGIKFQPSEIAKYLILLFLTSFFTQRADDIIAYSQPNRLDLLGGKVKTLLWIIVGLAVLMAMYLALGDMGPGLVIGISFILLYSMIKSKVKWEEQDDPKGWKRAFSCDFAMMVYGVLSFAGFLVVGYFLGMMWLFGLLWFVAWVAVGFFMFKKQLFESALLMNAVIFVFICGGQIMKEIPRLKDSSVVKRFEDRTSMCVNMWGDLDVEHLGANAQPVSNTQVANGLWALSTGGVAGQGLGNGKPSLIPAFHTDMILSSIGEQMGWLGLLLVVAALAVLLRRTAVTGYGVGHPFAFYLCMSIAIVTGVQFFVIALGSSGMIPLTGVTVPFLSFGRVSMIMNLVAFGIVLSLSSRRGASETPVPQRVRRKSVEQYGYPVAMITLTFLLFAVFTLGVWQYYQVWSRNRTLLHSAYVLNDQGVPVVEYNPRIALVESKMYMGRIYDCNDSLLATSDKNQVPSEKRNLKRYYPYGKHLFFMVGDNTDFAFDETETFPSGYFADNQHMSYLRGFDNKLYDANHKPVVVHLTSCQYRKNAFLASSDTICYSPALRDYSPLLPYLKDGIDGRKIKKHNDQVKKGAYDLHLTIDATLQVMLQNDIQAYMNREFKNNEYFHLMRVSVVVLNAKNGNLLASANYPLPDYEVINKMDHAYTDNFMGKDWRAYTDRDLGTTYPTAPGSTAKVISATAGFRKYGKDIRKEKYRITTANCIENKGQEKEPTGDSVTMWTAIVKSSNCYFVNLVNKKELFDELDTVYTHLGISIGSNKPYYFYKRDEWPRKQEYDGKIREIKDVAYRKYALFEAGTLRDPKDHQKKKQEKTNMSVPEWKWAWGQSAGKGYDMEATPLDMARMASAIVNNGVMPATQYVREPALRNEKFVSLLKSDEASILQSYMLDEAKNQINRPSKVNFSDHVGGKTGTPQRWRLVYKVDRYGTVFEVSQKMTDGWYMFFVKGDDDHDPIAVTVRIERGVGSGEAVKLAKAVVLPALENRQDSWRISKKRSDC